MWVFGICILLAVIVIIFRDEIRTAVREGLEEERARKGETENSTR